MIKELKQYQIQLTPFQSTKTWKLNNVYNDDLLLFESTGSDDGEPIDLEYIDYGDGMMYPITSSYCELALEQQSSDRAIQREGINLSGPFYPDIDPTNLDGTYKRSVYYQIVTAFYNNYKDVTKLWGVENIDFENSKIKRKFSDRLFLYDIPRQVYGDKIIPLTIKINNTFIDNDYVIVDDGNGNLIAEKNLFSKQQEIGSFVNEFSSGSSSICDGYFNFS
jgi:hypothetical protein